MAAGNTFRKVYFSKAPLTETDYKNSRTYSIFEAGSARAIATLTSGAFLAGYASYLGADDSFNGILGAVPVLAGIIQLISPILFEKLEKRKFLVSILCLLHRLMLGLMVLIPLISGSSNIRLFLITASYFISYLAGSFVNPAASGWLIDLAPDSIRGRFFSLRESYVLIFITVLNLVMGKVLDVFKENGREYDGFKVLFTIVIVFAVANFVFLSSMKEPPVKRNDTKLDIKKMFTLPLQDRGFIKIVILFVLWNLSLQIGGPFVSVYMVTGLKLEYTYIMVMSLITTVTMVVVVRIWGKVADRKSWSYVTKASLALLGICHIGWTFVNRDTSFILVPMLHLLGGMAWSGLNICLFNIQFQFTPETGRTIYIGFNAAVGGVIGFLSTLAGSAILKHTGNLKFSLPGINIGNMQMLFALSGLLLLASGAYTHFFIKEKVKE